MKQGIAASAGHDPHAQHHQIECQNPVYKTERIDSDKFRFLYRASFHELGIQGETVEIIEIGCPGNWIAPGSEIIKVNNDQIYTLWDGVFFLLEKQKNP